MTREPDRYDKIARDIFAQWERTRNAYPRDIAAALRQAESEALETAAQAFAESPATQHSGEAVAAILRYLKSPAAAPAAEPRDVVTGTARETYAGIDFTLGTTPVAPSLLPRVLAVLDAEYRRRGGDDGGGYVGALAAELRRYIAEMEKLNYAGVRVLMEPCEAGGHYRNENGVTFHPSKCRAALVDGGEGK